MLMNSLSSIKAEHQHLSQGTVLFYWSSGKAAAIILL